MRHLTYECPTTATIDTDVQALAACYVDSDDKMGIMMEGEFDLLTLLTIGASLKELQEKVEDNIKIMLKSKTIKEREEVKLELQDPYKPPHYDVGDHVECRIYAETRSGEVLKIDPDRYGTGYHGYLVNTEEYDGKVHSNWMSAEIEMPVGRFYTILGRI